MSLSGISSLRHRATFEPEMAAPTPVSLIPTEAKSDFRSPFDLRRIISPGESVLLIGARNGLLAFQLAQHIGSEGYIVATERDTKALAQTRDSGAIVSLRLGYRNIRFAPTPELTQQLGLTPPFDHEFHNVIIDHGSQAVEWMLMREAIPALGPVLRSGGNLIILGRQVTTQLDDFVTHAAEMGFGYFRVEETPDTDVVVTAIRD